MKSVIVESNHDRWLERRLDSADHRTDRDNTLPFLELELARMRVESEGNTGFNVLDHALRNRTGGRMDGLIFISDGGSFKICQESDGNRRRGKMAAPTRRVTIEIVPGISWEGEIESFFDDKIRHVAVVRYAAPNNGLRSVAAKTALYTSRKN